MDWHVTALLGQQAGNAFLAAGTAIDDPASLFSRDCQ
jgi:hypothetical protein